jgi:thiosulfate reductase/polysulfide reductase chain A
MVERANIDKPIEIKKVMCWPSPGCTNCGHLVSVKDGKIISMKGNPDCPTNRGAVCKERFPHFIEWLYHPDQLMYPLKRKGERGEGQWERISWDQALDEIASRLKELKSQFGAETLSVIEGTYRSDFYGIRSRFLNLFGNPHNMATAGTICGCNRHTFDIAVSGSTMPAMMLQLGNTKSAGSYVYCGSDISKARPVAWQKFKKRLSEEPRPKLIVIDPRKTEMAEMADMWLQIRPGTDAALFLAWINIIFEENLYDKEFVEKWTYGFNELRTRAAEYPPEKVAEITWIPADQIKASARLYALNRPSAITLGLGCDHIGFNAIRIEQTRMCLLALTGTIRSEFGLAPLGPGPIINGVMGVRDSMLQMEEKCAPVQRHKHLGSDRFKLLTWPCYEQTSPNYRKTYGIAQTMSGHNYSVPQPVVWRSILDSKPYPTSALITWGSNPLITGGNVKLIYKALKSENLKLHVVLEHFLTPTAMLADYVLPSASKLERGGLSTLEDFIPFFQAGEKAVEPLGERKPDYQFFRGLAVRLGFGEYFPWETEEELYNYRLKPLGITFGEAAREKYVVSSTQPWTYATINPATGKPTGFATPSGKLELYSNVLKALGHDPLPFFEEPPESPVRTADIAREYPLILITGGRFNPQFHSEHRQIGMGMREQHPEPLVEIHPETAGQLGLKMGDWAYIETLRGVIKQKVNITDKIHPRVVNCEHGWWFPEQPAREPWLGGMWESNCNVLTMDDPDTCDRLTGGWNLRALLCKVYKVDHP